MTERKTDNAWAEHPPDEKPREARPHTQGPREGRPREGGQRGQGSAESRGQRGGGGAPDPRALRPGDERREARPAAGGPRGRGSAAEGSEDRGQRGPRPDDRAGRGAAGPSRGSAGAVPQRGRDEAEPFYAPRMRFHAPQRVPPRIEHGTRVVYHITCARCGAEDDLSFVPKTKGDVLCRVCAEEVFGPHWARGRAEKPVERVVTYCCTVCSWTIERPSARPAPEGWRCETCRKGLEASEGDRVQGGVTVDAASGVRKVRRTRG